MRYKKRESIIYEFHLEGWLDLCWSEWFEGMQFQYETDEETGLPITALSGEVIDQSALLGILEKISRLNIKLLSVNEVRTKKV